MEQKILDYIKKYHMTKPGDTVYAACSGGADSVCLLLLLKRLCGELSIHLAAVHVEHGIRGEESLQDAAFVEALCRREGIPLVCRHVDVPAYAAQEHIGYEEAARLLRYQEFAKLGIVALAHHMEDNAETILFQMVRGSGLAGMCGMQPVRREPDVTYIRPLLECSRGEIEQYLAKAGEPFCIDATNADEAYSRNRMRRQVFPQLAQLNAQAVLHICQSAKRLQDAYDFVRVEADEAFRKLVHADPQGIADPADTEETGETIYRIAAAQLMGLHAAVRQEVIRQMLFGACKRQKDITAAHVEAVLTLAGRQSGRSLDLPYGMRAWVEHDCLCISCGSLGGGVTASTPGETVISPAQMEDLRRSGASVCIWKGQREAAIWLRVVPFDGNLEEISKNAYTKQFDYDKMKFGFSVRGRRSGDYLTIDRSGHTKKLGRYLIETKIPKRFRDEVPLLAVDSEVVWMVGGRISESFKLSQTTTYMVEVQYNGGESDGLHNQA